MSKNVLLIPYAFLTQSFESPLVINIFSNFHHDAFGKPLSHKQLLIKIINFTNMI